LLGRGKTDNLQIKDHPDKGIFVKDLTQVIVKNVKDTEKTLFAGLKNRHTGETAMNATSSRSHSIFTIYVETAEEPDKVSITPPSIKIVRIRKLAKLISEWES
jgi:hypothetical protein